MELTELFHGEGGRGRDRKAKRHRVSGWKRVPVPESLPVIIADSAALFRCLLLIGYRSCTSLPRSELPYQTLIGGLRQAPPVVSR